MGDSLSHFLFHLNFVSSFPSLEEILPVNYNYSLVTLSYLIASVAGYTGLNIAKLIHDRASLKTHSNRLLILGSVSMGFGIWAMHFIAMLAYSTNVEIHYDTSITIVSVIPAIIASWVTLKTMSRKSPTFKRILFQGLIIGLGIGTMHYVGMAAMIHDAVPAYHISTFILSIFIAWLLGVFTLYIRFTSINIKYFKNLDPNIITAAIWGASVSGMHYTGMSAFFLTKGTGIEVHGIASSDLVIPITIISITLILAALFISQFQGKLQSVNLKAEEHRSRMLQVIEEMSDGFIVVDKNNIIKIFNQQMQNIITGSLDYINTGEPLDTFMVWLSKDQLSTNLNAKQREQFINNFLSIQSHAESTELQLTDERWILLRQNINISGDIMMIWTDITARKKTDESLYQDDKMESLGRMVAGVAHEVNTPLSICLTLASELENSAGIIRDKYTNEEVSQNEFENYLKSTEEISDMFLANIRRAAGLIRNFKQVAVDQSHLEIEKIRLKSYTEQIIHTLHSEYKTINPVITVNGSEEYELTTTPGAYSQVIINLIKNSLLHAFENIDSPTIDINITPKQDSVVIEYIDNGVGMSQEVQEKIFEPFFTTKRQKGGTGLGMHIVFNIVTQKLKGTINIESKPNMGSRFTFTIPSN